MEVLFQKSLVSSSSIDCKPHRTLFPVVKNVVNIPPHRRLEQARGHLALGNSLLTPELSLYLRVAVARVHLLEP